MNWKEMKKKKNNDNIVIVVVLLLVVIVSAEDEPQAATIGGGLPTWGPPQGRNTYFHPFVGPAKSMKKARLHASTKMTHNCPC